MATRNRRLGFVVVLVALFAVLFIVNRRMKLAPEPADLILVNGKIVTVDAKFPTAAGIAVRGGRIDALGTDPKGFNRHVGDGTEIVDLGGALAIPGLIESHGHFMGLGESKTILDLTKAGSWDDIVALVAEAAKSAKPGEWITGRGWHQDKWDHAPEPNVEGLPFHDALSKVTPQ
ncbi:MAG: amidohydrolase family protein, partial [Candidatus Aminicenantales bacterium]